MVPNPSKLMAAFAAVNAAMENVVGEPEGDVSRIKKHDRAMALYWRGWWALVGGATDGNRLAREAFRQAAMQELDAVMSLPAIEENEPTRSILYCSASSMAIMGDVAPDLIERMAAAGLAGYPDQHIAMQLRENLRRAWELLSIEEDADYRGGTE